MFSKSRDFSKGAISDLGWNSALNSSNSSRHNSIVEHARKGSIMQ